MLDLPHVASRVFGTPLMIARGKLDVILGVLAPRLSGGAIAVQEEVVPAVAQSTMPDGIAVISVVGTLVSRSGYLAAASGLLSYQDIGEAIAAAFGDPNVRGILLEIDSPGGEVGGLFDLVERICALKAETGKPVWAVASESALSAAYAIASVADRLYVTRTAEVGSIGVVAVHIDESAADAKAGLAWSFVYAGERKIDGNSHQPLSDAARGAIQADVDRLYAELCRIVAANRGIPAAAVIATEAAIYRGELAIEAGLADRLGTLDGAVSEMAPELDRPTPKNPSVNPNPARRNPSMTAEPTPDVGTIPEAADTASVPASAAPESPSPLPASEARSDSDALRAEYAEIASIAAQAARLGVAVDAADAMKKGIKPDALRRSVLDALAARSEASVVVAAATAQPASGSSPIVRRARERAGANKS
jgi:signal peptide peptidase SppA